MAGVRYFINVGVQQATKVSGAHGPTESLELLNSGQEATFAEGRWRAPDSPSPAIGCRSGTKALFVRINFRTVSLLSGRP